MARPTEKEQYLSDFRQEFNDCCRIFNNDASGGQVQAVRDVLNRLTSVSRSLRYARIGELIDMEEYRSIELPLNQLLTLVSQHSTQMRSVPENTDHFHSIRAAGPNNRKSSKFNISPGQLQFLLSCRFTKLQIAGILHVSPKTVYRRLREFNLEETHGYSLLSDEALDEAVRSLINGNRRIGANAIMTRLQNYGLKIQRERVRRAVRRVDPAGVALRSRKVLRRRVYRVEGPNSLWHLDGNHKLIRWQIVVHAGIDGFSRLITFMKASTNNCADTVYRHFREATRQYGIPSRIRCDNGGENTKVCRFMEEYHGSNRGSAIRGKSVHNQRIERSWLDMWNGCINVFYDLFTSLEEDNLLNPNSEEQMYALQFVYIPRIQHALTDFINQWNHHKIRTEHSFSPVQLFVQRALQIQGSTSTATRELFDNYRQEDALDDDDLNSGNDDQEERDENLTYVNVFPVRPITEEQEEILSQQIDPLSGLNSDIMGVDIYLKVLDVLSEMLH